MKLLEARTVVGFLVAPAVPGVAILAFAALSGKFSEGVWAFLFGALIAYAAAIALGVPMYLLMSFLRLRSVWAYLAGGAALGLVTYAFLAPPRWMIGPDMPQGAMLFLLLAIGSGVVAAGTFWGIVRPDSIPT